MVICYQLITLVRIGSQLNIHVTELENLVHNITTCTLGPAYDE